MERIRGIFVAIELCIALLITNALMYIFQSKNYILRKNFTKLQAYFMGIRTKITGSPNLETQLYLLNHQSLLDIVAFEAFDNRDKCWVGKKEIEDIPLFGLIMSLPKMIAIDRKNKRSIIKIIKESRERIKEGRVITMFPEGTRGDGEKLLDFQVGAKILAEKLNLKVQPVVIVNTKNMLDSKKLLSRSGQISIIYLDAINPKDDENWFETMQKDMQERLSHELANYTSHR